MQQPMFFHLLSPLVLRIQHLYISYKHPPTSPMETEDVFNWVNTNKIQLACKF